MGRYDALSKKEAKKKYDEDTKENQAAWLIGRQNNDEQLMKQAHQNQQEVQNDWDEKTFGKSRYDSRTGVWYNADGTDTSSGGTDITQPYYNRKTSKSYGNYQREADDYRAAEFSYDPEADKSYGTYQKQYQKAAAKAMDDTVARVASRTGGVASSYAVGAGQAAYNEQMNKLTDRIPELEKLAYDRFMDDQSRRLRAMAMAKEEMAEDEQSHKTNHARYEKELSDAAAYQTAMQQYQQNGWDALSEAQKELVYRQGGYFDADGGVLVDGEGNRYASDYDPVWDALYAFQKGGRGALSVRQAKALSDAGYAYDDTADRYIEPSGRAIGRDPVTLKGENTAVSVALMKYQNGIRLSDAEMKLLAESMTEKEIADMVRKNSILKK